MMLSKNVSNKKCALNWYFSMKKEEIPMIFDIENRFKSQIPTIPILRIQ